MQAAARHDVGVLSPVETLLDARTNQLGDIVAPPSDGEDRTRHRNRRG